MGNVFRRLKRVDPLIKLMASTALAFAVVTAALGFYYYSVNLSEKQSIDNSGILLVSYLLLALIVMVAGLMAINFHMGRLTDTRLKGLADYVEQLRGYSVERIDAIQHNLENLSAKDESPPPPSEVPTESGITRPFSDRERENMLNIVGAMLELLKKPRSGPSNDTTVINSLIELYPKKSGLSSRNLQGKFAEAKRSLLSD